MIWKVDSCVGVIVEKILPLREKSFPQTIESLSKYSSISYTMYAMIFYIVLYT